VPKHRATRGYQGLQRRNSLTIAVGHREMTKPRVSILLPMYQAAEFVGKAIESVLAQTRSDWELVIVDNASVDASFAVAKEYADRDNRISLNRNKDNIGPVRNWQRCAALATGDLACLLFADDSYEPTFIESLSPALSDNRVGISYAAATLKEVGQNSGQVLFQLKESGLHDSRRLLLRAITASDPNLPVSPCCAMARLTDLRRWLAADIGLDDAFGFSRHGAGPDLWLFLQAWDEFEATAHCRTPQVSFLSHEGNLSRSKGVSEAYAWARLEYAERFLEKYPMALQRARARNLLTLWRHPLRGYVARRMNLMGWILFGGLGLAAVTRRGARAVLRTRRSRSSGK
jgi:glycosyltransferase involved in cell wall biosynthesis